jgi:hypothetical protein
MDENNINKLLKTLNDIILQYRSLINELNSKNIQSFIFNDSYHDLEYIVKRIQSETKVIQKSKLEINKKLLSKEFQFLKQNYGISEDELLPEKNKFRNYEDFAEYLNRKVYRAYSWDSFLFPFSEYYKSKEKLEKLIYDLKEKLKMINFYLNSYNKKIVYDEDSLNITS